MNGPVVPTAGQRLFARYAYAPNRRGYCGPADSAALFELAATGQTTADVGEIAARFSGAWPYLCVLAELAGIDEPLDERVVRAYWTGSSLLDDMNRTRFWRKLLDRIAGAGAGRYWAHLTPALLSEAMPTHGFHVFGVYPWTRLLFSPGGATPRTPLGGPDEKAKISGPLFSPGGATPRTNPQESPGETALHVLDSCRIRWGRVTAVDGDHAVILGRHLSWDGHALRLGEEREGAVRLTEAGHSFVTDVSPGDWLTVHWDLACERLAADQLWQLRRWTDWQLVVTNARLAISGGDRLSDAHSVPPGTST